jgi:hypothetical protein
MASSSLRLCRAQKLKADSSCSALILPTRRWKMKSLPRKSGAFVISSLESVHSHGNLEGSCLLQHQRECAPQLDGRIPSDAGQYRLADFLSCWGQVNWPHLLLAVGIFFAARRTPTPALCCAVRRCRRPAVPCADRKSRIQLGVARDSSTQPAQRSGPKETPSCLDTSPTFSPSSFPSLAFDTVIVLRITRSRSRLDASSLTMLAC